MKIFSAKKHAIFFFKNIFNTFSGWIFLFAIFFTYLIHYGFISFLLSDIRNVQSNEILKEIIFYNLIIQIWNMFAAQVQYVFPIFYIQNYLLALRLKLFKKRNLLENKGALVMYDHNLQKGVEGIVRNMFFTIPFMAITFIVCSMNIRSFNFTHLVLILSPFVFLEIVLSVITYRYERRIIKLDYQLKNNLIAGENIDLYEKDLIEYRRIYITSYNIQAYDGIIMRVLFSIMQFIFLHYVIFNDLLSVKDNSENIAQVTILLNEMSNAIRFLSLAIRSLILSIYRVKHPLNLIE